MATNRCGRGWEKREGLGKGGGGGLMVELTSSSKKKKIFLKAVEKLFSKSVGCKEISSDTISSQNKTQNGKYLWFEALCMVVL